MAAVTVKPARRVRGRVRVPGDKSISHRYALLAALADGRSTIRGFAPGADCEATLSCLARLGVAIDRRSNGSAPLVEVTGAGARHFAAPSVPLDAANSGTTIRLLTGVLAGQPGLTVQLVGDASLSRRPMRRIVDPLSRMGASIESTDGRPPLRVEGRMLSAIDFAADVPSAQVKSAILLAGLFAEGMTSVHEPIPTRDHTERAFKEFGVESSTVDNRTMVRGGQTLTARDLEVPGDISSAVFWAVAAAALPDSDVTLADVGLNPTRTAILDVLRHWGADVEIRSEPGSGSEPRGSVRVRYGVAGELRLGPAEVPGVIDEIPALAALAATGGRLHVSGAAELRLKESDRIAALVRGLSALGARTEEWADGFSVEGGSLAGGTADAVGDHRLAMAFALAALSAKGPSSIVGADAVRVSYPGFFDTLAALTR